VPRRAASRPSRLTALVALAIVAVAVPVSGGASPSAGTARRASELQAQNATLAAGARSAVLGLYALDSQLTRTRARLEALGERRETLRREAARLRRQLDVAHTAWTVAQRQLMTQLRVLYEQGETDPLAVLLGSTSLDEAVTSLENVNRAAELNRTIVEQTRAARVTLRRALRRAAAHAAAVERLEASTQAAADSLARERARRVAYLASLAERRRLNERQLGALEAAAAQARARAAQVAPAAGGGPTAHGAISVVATGYSRQGPTATGIPAGWGVVAVDPSVIPLGTRLAIPGYGSGVAADVGSSVHGAVIDLWFPTPTKALAWGRRTVTVAVG
jgi:3D (Asp-Asp-Asp) domain-containing protein/septal ring factor EnvC (AmiA/AmiB activator)